MSHLVAQIFSFSSLSISVPQKNIVSINQIYVQSF